MNLEKETKMKNLFIQVLAILTLFALLTIHFGCASSPPARFYLLSSLDTAPPGMKPAADEPCVSIGIGPVKMPDYLEQTKIVTRGEGNQLTLAEFDRWAELLKDNLVRVLAKIFRPCSVRKRSFSSHGEGEPPLITGSRWKCFAWTAASAGMLH